MVYFLIKNSKYDVVLHYFRREQSATAGQSLLIYHQ